MPIRYHGGDIGIIVGPSPATGYRFTTGFNNIYTGQRLQSDSANQSTMDSLHFAYWLKGFTEITNGAQPDALQWAIIKDHLELVFNKVTPDRFGPRPEPTYCSPVKLTGNMPVCGASPSDPTLPTDGRICGGLLYQIGDRPPISC